MSREIGWACHLEVLRSLVLASHDVARHKLVLDAGLSHETCFHEMSHFKSGLADMEHRKKCARHPSSRSPTDSRFSCARACDGEDVAGYGQAMDLDWHVKAFG